MYPKSRQEMVLWEKINYLYGMCYPNYIDYGGDTMVSPITTLTIGKLCSDTWIHFIN